MVGVAGGGVKGSSAGGVYTAAGMLRQGWLTSSSRSIMELDMALKKLRLRKRVRWKFRRPRVMVLVRPREGRLLLFRLDLSQKLMRLCEVGAYT